MRYAGILRECLRTLKEGPLHDLERCGVLMGSFQNLRGPVTGVSARSIIDHTDQSGPVTVTISSTDHGGPAPTDIDEIGGGDSTSSSVEVESGLGRGTSGSWSGELTLFRPWRSRTLAELSEDCISHWTERQHGQSHPP